MSVEACPLTPFFHQTHGNQRAGYPQRLSYTHIKHLPREPEWREHAVSLSLSLPGHTGSPDWEVRFCPNGPGLR